MIVLFKVISESIAQAIQQLWANRLRSFLSLMGIMIGIFCIIGVLSAVDSLEDNVRGSFEKLGNDVLYIQKFSWAEDPGQNWFKYIRRPNISYEDFEVVQERARLAELASYNVEIGTRTVKYLSNSVDRVFMFAISYDFGELFQFEFEKGRYFSPSEYYFGSNKAVLGNVVAEELFGPIDPIGKTVKVGGRKMEVIGVMAKSGESLVDIFNYDETVIISYEYARKIANLKSQSPFGNSTISVKAAPGVKMADLRDELTGKLRAHRRLRPKEEDDFSLNELSILSNLLNNFFTVLNLLGIVIGGFAIFVGMFSVANIMFVSVKERTNIIGIKKALGAKPFVILLEFLIESIILCIIGGAIGLLLVLTVVSILSRVIDFSLFLSIENIVLGLTLSVFVGVFSGFIPALQASRMDPVEAMRK